jgi:hypothetical protein
VAEVTRSIPSAGVREFIANVTEDALEVERRVLAFTVGFRQAVTDFSAEVDPMHLSDTQYNRLVARCGLKGMLAVAERMRAALGEVVESA